MSETQEQQEFRTADMALAAFLVMEGLMFERIEASDGTGHVIAECVFDQDPRLRELVDEYELGDAIVEPLTFQRKVAFVRNRMMDCVRDFRAAEKR